MSATQRDVVTEDVRCYCGKSVKLYVRSPFDDLISAVRCSLDLLSPAVMK